jgi:uncharacterized membrane protein
MTGAGLSFANLGWLPVVAALWLLTSLVTLVAHGRAPAVPLARLALALRLAGLTLVALALLEPSWSTARPRPGANHFAVLVDGSRSMQLPDGQPSQRDQVRSRGDALRALLSQTSPWQRALGETYQLKRYRFDTRLERVADFADPPLSFDGQASNLGAALRALGDRWKGAPLAGVLLFTDGVATDLDELARLQADGVALPPIYPVVAPSAAPASALRDVAVTAVSASETLFEDAPVHVDAEVEALGLEGKAVTATLLDDGGHALETRTFTPAAPEQRETLRFRVKVAARSGAATPGSPAAGTTHYRVTVRPADGVSEVTTANNARHVLVPRPRGAARLLYVGGRPNWEYKFLRRALEGDRVLELAALVRIAPREPKFAFLSRKGEATNPLYRGFGATASDAERFDEAVLQRLGTRDADELRGGFPTTPAALFEFSGLILDDIEAGFFTAAQQALVERFVSERGGGLMMLGGIGSYRQGGYARTPIGDLLPVYLDRGGDRPALPVPAPAQLRLTREGWLETWTRLHDTEAAERTRLAGMPPFQVASATHGLKPSATVLYTLAAGKDEQPALVVQRAGEGRVATLTVGDLWRWGLHHAPEEPDDLGKFWRQTLRALIADVPPAVTAALEPRPGEAGALAVTARVLGPDFRPVDDARVEADVIAPDGGRTHVVLAPSGRAPGGYESSYRPQGGGVYRVELRATSTDGRSLGEAGAGRALDLDADEHRSIRPDRASLEALAHKTGGVLTAATDLEALANRLRAQPAPVSDLVRRPLWSSWLVWLSALACLAGAWALRRRGGLA